MLAIGDAGIAGNQRQSHVDDEEDKSYYIGSRKISEHPTVVTDRYGVVHPTLPPYVPRRNRSKSPPTINESFMRVHLCPIYKPIDNSQRQLYLDDNEDDTYYFGCFKVSGKPPVVTDPYGRQCPIVPYEDFLCMRSSTPNPNHVQQ